MDTARERKADYTVPIGPARDDLRVFRFPERYVAEPKLKKRRADFTFDIDDADEAMLPSESESDDDPDTEEEDSIDLLGAVVTAPAKLYRSLGAAADASVGIWHDVKEAWGDFKGKRPGIAWWRCFTHHPLQQRVVLI